LLLKAWPTACCFVLSGRRYPWHFFFFFFFFFTHNEVASRIPTTLIFALRASFRVRSENFALSLPFFLKRMSCFQFGLYARLAIGQCPRPGRTCNGFPSGHNPSFCTFKTFLPPVHPRSALPPFMLLHLKPFTL